MYAYIRSVYAATSNAAARHFQCINHSQLKIEAHRSMRANESSFSVIGSMYMIQLDAKDGK